MLKDVNFNVVYSSGEKEPSDFFLNALMNSDRFDLGLGFFQSSAFRALALGFAYFIYKGGQMRIIVNDTLSEADKIAIENGLISEPDKLIEKKFIETLNAIFETLSSYERHFFNCISWLIATKKLEFLIITPSNSRSGLAHQKFGLFYDSEDNIVAFNGSANFTKTALKHNLETISCYRSWTGEKSVLDTIDYYKNLFNKIWTGKADFVRIIPVSMVKTIIREKFPVQDIEELIEKEDEIVRSESGLKSNRKILNQKYEEIKINSLPDFKPAIPNKMVLYDYQVEAFAKWESANYQGLFEMATGTGKTITAISCGIRLYEREEKISILILVPTLDLITQWEDELRRFGFSRIIIASSKQLNWYNDILTIINQSFNAKISYAIIATYATFPLDKFQSILNKLPKETLLIADEVHNFGTERLIEKYPLKISRRIGLSATPARYFDEDGTSSLLDYFNAKEGPTVKLDMGDAIERGFLSRYYYYPYTVSLTEDEMMKYRDLSQRLMQYFDPGTGRFNNDSLVSMLLMQRKRIIHRAENKLIIFRRIFDELLSKKENLKYTLVYVPEGRPEEYDDEDERLINEYSMVISEEFKLKQHQFTGITANRDDVLKRFASGKIAVLTAMKCLDEGVDVRRTEVAVFCASTGNPRQFVQRRGRILRKHPDKQFAFIYDMIVVPTITSKYFSDSLKMERNLLRNELIRVKEFAFLAVNKFEALKEIESVAEDFHLDIYSSD